MATNTKNNSGAIKEAAKAVKYTAKELTTDRMYYTSSTVRNSIEMAKDLREWTRRNNPFKAVNGNKDPLVRQIATASMKGLQAAKQDLLHGDLRFSRLNKEFRTFVGGEDPEHAFDYMDIDYSDWASGDSEDGNEERSAIAIGESISRDFTDTQMASTSAMIGAVETATDRISTISFKSSQIATDRIISANLANMSRISTQIGQATGELTTLNQNMSLLVQQGNDVATYLGQSQKFMENTEQSLNDIKSLLNEIAAPARQTKRGSSYNDQLPDWLDSGFNPKAYIKYVMNETAIGNAASYVVGTAFKALHLEIPSIIAEEFAQDLPDIKPLKLALDKFLPAFNKLSKLDDTLSSLSETFFAKLDNGEYGGILSTLGMQGFGFRKSGSGKRLFSTGGYNRGAITWNGKSERALQEVIPSYLSSIEGYIKNIAEGLELDRAERKNIKPNAIDNGTFRHYDYNSGKFFTLDQIRTRARKEFDDAAQSAFYDIMHKIEDNVQTGGSFNSAMTEVMRKVMSDEDTESDPQYYDEFKRVIQRYRLPRKFKDPEILELWHELNTTAKRNAVGNLNDIRNGASNRDNYMYLLGKELNDYTANVKFDTRANLEMEEREKYAKEHSAAELREYDKQKEEEKRQKERQEGLKGKIKSFVKSTDAGKYWYDVWEDIQKHGGVLNRAIEYTTDYGIEMPLLKLVHGIKGYAKGTGVEGLKGNQVIAAHDGEIIFTKAQSDAIRSMYDDFFWKDAKNKKQKVTRPGPVNSLIGKFFSSVRNKDVERASTPAEEAQERLREISDNIATMTAIEVNTSENELADKRKSDNDKLVSSLLGEKNSDGYYSGKAFSNIGNAFVDIKNQINHAITGEEYVTASGKKIAKTDNCLTGDIGKSLSRAGDAAATTLFGANYKDSKFYKKASAGYNDYIAGLKATRDGVEVDDEFWQKHRQQQIFEAGANGAHASIISKYKDMNPEQRKRTDALLQKKLRGARSKKTKLEKNYAKHQDSATAFEINKIDSEINRITRNIQWIAKFNDAQSDSSEVSTYRGVITPEEAERIANEVLFGVKDPSDAGRQIFSASQELYDASNDNHAKFLRNVKFGVAGAIGVPLAKFLGLGAIPSFFLPGGPIGGAILGIGASILSKNQTFMAHMFGGEDKDGTKIDGIISQDLQTKFKTIGQKILGPATIGAVGGLIFPKAVGFASKALGPILGSFVGTGPIGGAVIASGAALLLGSEKVKNAFFGKDDEGNATGIISKGIAKGRKFLADNKDSLKRLGLGTLGGALVGAKMFGLTGLALGPTILGSIIGISTASSKFTDFLFGTKMMSKDEHGNEIWTRDGNGLIGKIGRMMSVNVIAPIKSFVANGTDRLIEYVKHDIGFSIRSMFAPFTIPIQDSVKALSESFKKIGDKAAKLAKKFFDPLLGVGSGLLKGLTRLSMGVTRFGMGIAGQIIASPLKLLGGIGNFITRDKKKKAKNAEYKALRKDFWKGYTDENGTFHDGFWGKFLSPTVWGERIAKGVKTKGVKNKVSGFLDAINPFMMHGDAVQNFAKERGVENDTTFMSGLFGSNFLGGEWKRHKDAKNLIGRNEQFDAAQIKWAQRWARKDKYNNKIQLTDDELGRRNRKLKKIYSAAGMDYTNMSNDQMMQFIYDPLGKRGENKEKILQREEERHAEMKSVVETIQHGVSEIADVLTGRKRHRAENSDAKDSTIDSISPESMVERSWDNLAGVYTPSDEETYDGSHSTKWTKWKIRRARRKLERQHRKEDRVSKYDGLPLGEKVANRWNDYVDWAWDGTVGRTQRGFNTLKTNIGTKVTNFKTKSNTFFDKFSTGFDNTMENIKYADVNLAKKIKGWKDGAEDRAAARAKRKRDKEYAPGAKYSFSKLTDAMSKVKESSSKAGEKFSNFWDSASENIKYADVNLAKKIKGWKDGAEDRAAASAKRKREREYSRPYMRDVLNGAWNGAKNFGAKSKDRITSLFDEEARAKRKREREYGPGAKYPNNPFSAFSGVGSSISAFGSKAKDKMGNAWNSFSEGVKYADVNLKKKFKDWKDGAPERAEKRAKLKREYGTYKFKYKQNVNRMTQLLRDAESGKQISISDEEAQSLGIDTSKDLTEQLRSKLRSSKKLSKRAFGKAGSMEVALKATKGSLMEMFIHKKSILVGLGTVALGVGVTALITKFPKVIDFVKDTLWPFLKNTVVGLIKGIGAAICGVGDFIRGAKNTVTSFLNFTTTGKWEKVETKEAADNFAHQTGSMTLEERIDNLANSDGSGVAAVVGKRTGEAFTKADYLAAAMVYAGTEYKRDIKNDGHITASAIIEYAKEHRWSTNKIYNKILNDVGDKKRDGKKYAAGHSSILWEDKNELYNAACIAADYLNNERETYKASQAAAVLDSAGVEDPDAVGYGHFVQTDPRWKNRKFAKYGSGFTTMGNGGCGPTALANVAVQNGIRTNPLAIASMAHRMGYTAQGGSNARLFSEGAGRLGLRSTPIGKGGIRKALSRGNKVVFAGRGNNGLYTNVGHILSARGLDKNGNAIVDDPMRKKSIHVPLSKIGNGITNAWSIGRGSDTPYAYADGGAAVDRSNFNAISADTNTDANTTSDSQTANTTFDSQTADQMFKTTESDAMTILLNDSNNGQAFIYYQVDPKWASKDLKYGKDTIGNGGCVISALGSLLANITGLNYRPDYFTEVLGGQNNPEFNDAGRTGRGIMQMLKAALPPSLQGKAVRRVPIYRDATDDDASLFTEKSGVDMKNVATMGGNSNDTDKQMTAKFVRRNLFTNPFILYGGSDYGSGMKDISKDIFLSADGTYRYPTHAVLVIPDRDTATKYAGKIVDQRILGSDAKYHIFNPGTQKVARQNQILSYDDLFDKKQGIQSMIFVDDAVNRPTIMASYTKKIKSDDAKWFFEKSKTSYDTDATGYDVTYDNGDSSSASADNGDSSSASAGSDASGAPSESDGENWLIKLTTALGKLGNIAMNVIGSIFGGKYKSIYDGSSSGSSSSGSSGGSSASWNYEGPTMSDMIDDYISRDPYAQSVMNSGNASAITALRKGIEAKITQDQRNTSAIVSRLEPSGVTAYSSLPNYAKTSAGIATIANGTKMPTSIRLAATDIENIEEGITRLVWNHEAKGDYASIIKNDNGGISAGIGGFHNGNLIEILTRMKNSGELDDDDQTAIDGLLSNGFTRSGDEYYIKDDYYDTLVHLLNTKVSRDCQDAFLHQMHISTLTNLVDAYDNNVFNDPRSLMAIGQFQGFGPAYVSGMLGKSSKYAVSGFPDAFKKLSYNANEELANTLDGMNKYYSTKTGNYTSGHKNRFREVYQELGGMQSLGFGAGIRDSYNTYGYYDSVDTPVAINSDHKVVIEDQPITSRLDTIIEYMRKLIILANSSSQGGATTARDNLDLGYGLANDMKLKNAGLQRKETVPIYRKDNTYVDKMRVIHNKIARSPRPV